MNILEKLLDLGFNKDIASKYIDLAELYKYKKGYIIKDYTDKRNRYIYILLSGKIRIHFQSDNHLEFIKEISPGDIVGIEFTMFGYKLKSKQDIEDFSVLIDASEDSEVLCLPINKLVKLNFDSEFWKILSFRLAENYMKNMYTLLEKNMYDPKIYFLRYLKKNNFKINFTRSSEVAEALNINLRTFQRIVKFFKEKDVIFKEKNCIKVKNMQFFDYYINKVDEVRSK